MSVPLLGGVKGGFMVPLGALDICWPPRVQSAFVKGFGPNRRGRGQTHVLESILLGALFVFATLSLRAEPPEESTFSLSPGDVTEATIDTSGRTRLQVTLTAEKSAELPAFTGRNLNKQVKIV